MPNALPPPQRWLAPLVAALVEPLRGAAVEGVVSGGGWLSLRVEGRYLWLVARGALRMAWVDDRPLPRGWLSLLGRHQRSPFASHLRGRHLDRVELLVGPDEAPEGLRVNFVGPPPLELRARFWPRPGALWLQDDEGEPLAQNGRMEGPELRPLPTAAAPLELPDHGALCRRLLEEQLGREASRRIRQLLGSRRRRLTRRLLALEAERDEAERDATIRARADVLAAHLYALRPGTARVELLDFEGRPTVIELDPSLPPARHLDKMYRRAARAERKREAVAQRLDTTRDEQRRVEALAARLEETLELEALLGFAEEAGISLEPGVGPTRRRDRETPRLPYRAYRLASGVEIRVGRSATDNDRLTFQHSHKRDLWLHASGAQGSHVILRTGGREISGADVERAAMLAAHFSRAKHAHTVPVLVTERRHVRKPRGAARGAVIAERAKTLFVGPGIPEGCEPLRDDGEPDSAL